MLFQLGYTNGQVYKKFIVRGSRLGDKSPDVACCWFKHAKEFTVDAVSDQKLHI